MTIEIIADTAPVHLLGESHVLSYAGLVARDTGSGRVFTPSAKCLISLKAGDYADPASATLNGELLDALQELSISGKAGPGGGAVSPASFVCLALFAGDMDLHAELFTQMDTESDVDLPGHTPYPAAMGRPLCHSIDGYAAEGDVRAVFRRRAQPFVAWPAAHHASCPAAADAG